MTIQLQRRRLLTAAAGGATALALGSFSNSVFAGYSATESTANPSKREKHVIRLANTHTYEELNVTYKVGGNYIEQSLDRLDYHLRDHRKNEAIVMDRRLFDQLYALQQTLESNEIFEIISGYRSAKTNAMLRSKSSGVAKNSFHILGRALDIRLRNTSLSDLHQAALDLKAGGVGRYSSSNFIHIDTGEVRNWGS